MGATLHLAMEDATDDSAIVEFLNGKPVTHHGRQYQIMTNDPTYDEQLALLKKQDFSHPSMDLPIPGNVNAVDRFQRASYYKAVLPELKSEREAVAGVLAIMRNVSVRSARRITDSEYTTPSTGRPSISPTNATSSN